MKTTLMLIIFAAALQYAAGQEKQIIEKGPHHRTWKTAGGGTVIELEGGMNRRSETGEWVPATSRIELFNDGAVVRNAQFGVIFSPSLATPGSIDVETADGQRLIGHPLCLLLTEGNNSVTIAEIQDCAGELVGAEQSTLIYRNAFTDYNIDLEYRVTKSSLNQWLVMHEPIDPREYGMSDEAVLELLTEWTTLPETRRDAREWLPATVVQRALVDERISLGAMEFVTGKAFAVGTSPENGVPVAKTLERFADNRVCLVEKVPVKWIASEMQKLPKPQAGVKPRRQNNVAVKRGTSLPVVRQAATKPKPIRMAAVERRAEPGFILDFELATSVSSMTWRADATYYISGSISVTTNFFEGGVIIKTAPTNSAKLTITGPVTCYTDAFKPVVITGRDDGSLGEAITTNALSGGFYATVGLELDYNTSGLLYTLQNFRVSHAETAIKINGGHGHVLRHCVVVHSGTAFSLQSASASIQNGLGYDVGIGFNGSGASSATGRLENVTITLNSNFNNGGNCRMFLTNSLLVGVTNIGSYSGIGNAESVNPAGIFDAVGAGFAYLAATNAVWRDAGTTEITPALLADLKTRTTFAPIVITNVLVTQSTNLLPSVGRDTNGVELGFHYPAVDFAVNVLAATNATLYLSNGVSIMAFGDSGFWLKDNSALVSEGSPLAPNIISRFVAVQEQSTNWGGGSVNNNSEINCYNFMNSPPTAKLRFTEFYTMASSGWHLQVLETNWVFSNVSLNDCAFNSGNNWFGGWHLGYSGFTNILFYRVANKFAYYGDIKVFNNLFKGGAIITDKDDATNSWIFRNNSFDNITVQEDGLQVTNSHNAYINASARLTPNDANDVVLSTFAYTNGPFGDFYQVSTNLINEGSVATAGAAGMYHYTTTLDQSKEFNSVLDIGLHYIAADGYGEPLDSDLDGIPDYLQDPAGDGIVEPDEIASLQLWLRADLGVVIDSARGVTNWWDQSGENRHVYQNTAANRPVLTNNIINGEPVIRFSSGSQQLVFSNNAFSTFSEAEMFVVLKAGSDNPGDNRTLGLFGPGGTTKTSYPQSSEISDGFGSSTAHILRDPSQPLDEFHVYNVASAPDSWWARINGVMQHQTSENTVQWRSGCAFGALVTIGINGFGGDIAEVLVFSPVLSAADRASVNAYLADRYGFSFAAPEPSNLVARAISSDQISLVWDAYLSNSLTSFVIERKSAGGIFAPLAIVDQTASWIDRSLAPSTQFYYRVKARTFLGDSRYSNEPETTTMASGEGIPFDNAVVWLKGDAGHGAAGPVGAWTDQSGASHDARPTTSATRPYATNNIINGRTVIHFDATDDTCNILYDPFAGMTEGEVMGVVKAGADVPGANRRMWGLGSSPSYYPLAGGSIQESFGSSVARNIGNPSQPLDQFHIYGVVASSSQWLALENGGLQYSTTTNTFDTSASPGLGGASTPFNGDIAEFVVFNRVLSAAERRAVGSYLNFKYNLLSNTPVAASGLLVAGVSPTEAAISWTNAAAAGDSYDVERKLGAGGSYSYIGTGWGQSFSDTNSPGNSNFYYRAKAYNYYTNADYSAAVAPPWLSITNPPAGSIVSVTNQPIGADAQAVSASITQVVFYAAINSIGTTTNSPYTVTWTNAFSGATLLTAKAWDSSGNTRISPTSALLVAQDTDGDGVNDYQEIVGGTNPYATDTDGDGVSDATDAFPLDPGRSSIPTPDSGDMTPPTIILDEPAEATPLP